MSHNLTVVCECGSTARPQLRTPRRHCCAAALAQRVRDDTGVTVAYQLLVYPMLDDRSGTTPQPHAKKFRLWNQKCNRFGWAAYLRDADPNVAVSARNDDLSGLPPAWIGVGSLDLFYEETSAISLESINHGAVTALLVVPAGFSGRPGRALARSSRALR